MTSKIKVDNIENQCGGAVVTKCGATTTISGSVVKADDIQAADGGNLINQCGTTITLGASGDTIELASGASQTGFGRTGTVDWQTGSIKTATFTAANGEGYFANTTGSAFSMNLPASPSAGNIVSVSDYAQTFASNNLTVDRNGSNIEGDASNLVLNSAGLAMTFVYVDATKGWKVVNAGREEDSSNTVEFLTATGGTITTSGNCKIHTFTGPGTFTVTEASTIADNNKVAYMIVAGGGSGGGYAGAGAGGFREGRCNPITPYTASPLVTTGVTVTATAFPIVVGAGASSPPCSAVGGDNGSDSSALGLTSTGGGGAVGNPSGPDTKTGGSGGGGYWQNGGGVRGSGSAGNTPPVSPPQGNPGGNGNDVAGAPNYGGGGGGGAGATGGSASPGGAGGGGNGVTTSITGSSVARAGGGGGGGYPPIPDGTPSGGTGGGGPGGYTSPNRLGGSGTVNTGGGGGASPPANTSGAGGSGIVVIRYKFQ